MAVLNPIRYRGYFYDTETGFYYLNSRYYDPEIGRFINADGYVSTGQSFLGYNMFAYCNNNPVNLVDTSGSMAAVAAASAGALTGIGSLALIGMSLGVGIVASAVGIGAIVGAHIESSQSLASSPCGSATTMDPSEACEPLPPLSIPKAEEKEKEVTASNPKKQAYFPSNPYDFHPKGLIFKDYPGTGNGKVIKWFIPGTKTVIFEWDEDFKNGPHYHAIMVEWGSKHKGPHYPPGHTVPEPWNTTYFGG